MVLVDIDQQGVESVADRVRISGRKALAMQVDVSQEDQVQKAVDKAVAEFGRIGKTYVRGKSL